MHTTNSTHPAGSSGEDSHEEALTKLKADLRIRAESIAAIPEGYVLTIQQYERSERDGAVATFVWTVPGTDTGILVELRDNGDLLHYSNDGEEDKDTTEKTAKYCTCDELRSLALRFVLGFYPDALDQFVPVRDQARTGGGWLFEYGRKAMGLSLPYTGFRVRMSADGAIVDFRYHGSEREPVVPPRLVPKGQLLKRLAESTDFRLEMSLVTEGGTIPCKEKLRLVYRPHPYIRSFEADALRACLDAAKAEENEDEDESGASWVEAEVRIEEEAAVSDGSWSVLRWIGLDPTHYELLREAEIDGKTGLVWRRIDYTSGVPDDLSLNSFFQNRNEQTIKAQIDPGSGRLVSFMRFDEAADQLCLSRDECRDVAVRFLNRAAPGLLPFLQMRLDDSRDDSDTELFVFRVQIGGTVLDMEQIRICINKTTGQPDQLLGLSVTPEQLAGFDTTPCISSDEARKIYSDAVDLQLEWETDYSASEQARSYRMKYRVVHNQSGQNIRLVDAHTREIIDW